VAIKEFIIGPQNYFEPGYFDGDYTHPNVAKTFLECDIDNIKGGRVITGEYYLGDYIDGTYYHNNSMSFNISVDAMVVQLATVGLTGYYQEGYFGPGYSEQRGSFFVLAAELERFGEDVFGSGTISSTATMNITAVKTVSAVATMSVAFTQTAQGARDRDIDLFAFGEAAIAVQITRIRDNNTQATAVFDIATDGRRFRDLASAEISLFDIAIANSRSRAFNLETQAAFSISASVFRTVPGSAALVAASTLNIVAGFKLLGNAAVNVRSQVFASKYLGSARPRTYDDAGNYSSTAKYGTASLLGLASGAQLDRNITLPPPRPGQDWVYESYIYPTTSTITGSSILTGSNTLFLQLEVNSNRTVRLEVSNNTSVNTRTVLYTVTSSAVSVGAWHHITVVKNSSALSFYIDGSRVGTFTASAGWDSYGIADIPYLGQSAKSNLFLDESSMAYGTTYGHNPANTTITVPTTSRVNDPATTQFLYHWEGNGIDDISVQHFGQAALSAASAISAQANANTKQGVASLTTTVTQSTVAGELQSVTSAFTSQFTQSTASIRIRPFAAAISSAAQVSGVIGSIKSAASTNLVAFNTAFSVTAQLAGVALLETATAVTAIAVKTTDVVSQQNSTANITATLSGIVRITADLGVVVIQSTVTDRTRNTSAALASAFTHTVADTLFKGHSAALAVSATVTAAATKLKIAVAAFNVSAATEISARKTTDVISTQSVSTAISTVNQRVRFTVSNINAVVTFTAQAIVNRDPVITLTSVLTQVTVPVKTADSDIIAVSLFTPSFDVDFITRPQVFFETATTLTVLTGVIRSATTQQSVGMQTVEVGSPLHSVNKYRTLPLFGLRTSDPGFTAAIWARREAGSANPQPLWSSIDTVYDGDQAGGLVFDGNDLLLRHNFDPDEPGGRWSSVVPGDGDWHQYVIRAVGASSPARYWQAWIDGESIGLSSGYFAVQSIGFFDSQSPVARIGNGQIADIAPGYTPSERRLTGAVAQIWMGLTNGIEIDHLLQESYRDLGDTGDYNSQIPQPYIYNRLQAPFTGVVNAGVVATTPISYTNINARCDFTAQPAVALVYTADLVSTASQQTAITYASAQATVTVTAQSTQTTAATQFTGVVTDFVNTTSMSVAVTKTTGYVSTQSAQFVITAIPGLFENAEAALSTSAEVFCDFDNIPPIRAEADLAVQFTVTADITSFTDSTTLTVSAFTVVCDVTLIPPIRVEADLTANFTVTAVIGSIEQFASLVMSAGTINIDAGKITGITQSMQITTVVTVSATKFHGLILTLTAFNTQLTVGEIINIDPHLQLIIEPETRINKIPQESRVFIIESETRVNIIKD
jgi:hypothetical protein